MLNHLSDQLSPRARWELAVQVFPPARLARSFAVEVGQFYNRREFDALAQRAHDLYAAEDPEWALLFRNRLDQRLCDRYHAPVPWDVTSLKEGAAPPGPRAA